MTDNYLGEIRAFAFNFEVGGGANGTLTWAYCNGQLLQMSQFQALYALIGTTYGGDGKTTFALPNLQGSVPLGAGVVAPSFAEEGGEEAEQALGISNYLLAAQVGSATVAIPVGSGTPAHSHSIVVQNVTSQQDKSMTAAPSTKSWLSRPIGNPNPGSGVYNAERSYVPGSQGTQGSTLNPATILPTGGSGGTAQPHANMQPYLALNYCIALSGTWPSPS